MWKGEAEARAEARRLTMAEAQAVWRATGTPPVANGAGVRDEFRAGELRVRFAVAKTHDARCGACGARFFRLRQRVLLVFGAGDAQPGDAVPLHLAPCVGDATLAQLQAEGLAAHVAAASRRVDEAWSAFTAAHADASSTAAERVALGRAYTAAQDEVARARLYAGRRVKAASRAG